MKLAQGRASSEIGEFRAKLGAIIPARQARRLAKVAYRPRDAQVRPGDDAPMVHGDGRIDQIAAQRPQPRQNPVLVGSGKPRIADDVGHQDRSELSSLAHGANAEA
jgi:hypothetical protein